MPIVNRQLAAALVTGSIICASGCSVAQAATAADARSGITMSPALKQLEVSSGLIEAHNTITLTNNTSATISASLRTADLSSLSNSFGFTGSNTSRYGLANWMTLPNGNQVTVAPKSATSIPVNISNRSDLAPGGHYGAVIISAGVSLPNSNKVSFKQELVSLVFVKKLGGEQYGLKLTSIKPGAGSLPKTASLRFSGTGNVDSVPRGFIQITNSRGTVLAKGIINPQSTLVLPGTSHQFDVDLTTVASSKLPGRKIMTVYYRPDGVSAFMSKSITLQTWFRPVAIAVSCLLVAAATVILIIRRLRK